MSPLLVGLAVVCGVLFLVSATLFAMTGVRRRKLASALGSADIPERRWTYDQEDMIAFVGEASRRHVNIVSKADKVEDTSGPPALEYYSKSILSLDIVFAISFASFVALAGLLAAEWLTSWPWVARACVISASLGIVYGAADVAEDLKLRSIFTHAQKVVYSGTTSESRESGTALADAAEVDAANALTRVKIASIIVSVIGLLAFLVFSVLDKVVAGLSSSAIGTRSGPAGQETQSFGTTADA